ncbi:hypothetical protein CsatA_015713 [Cannabis sativa]
MAELFVKQSEPYAQARPDYPKELFEFIATKTPFHDLAWDVGTGTGQAAHSLAEIYKNVIGTDTSLKQLQFTTSRPNIRYEQTPPVMSTTEVNEKVAPESSVDLVTVAQALHWLDLPNFYEQVRFVLKKPNGVVAAWCYTLPRVNDSVDQVLDRFYAESHPYWDSARKLVENEYRDIDFPFEPVDGTNETGPFQFVSEKMMNLEEFLTYLKSWSAYQTAKDKGVELLVDRVVEDFKGAWESDEGGSYGKKVVKYPVFLRIGKVKNV